MGAEQDFYRILGVPNDASPEEIRSAYFEAARTMHPDVNPAPDANEKFLAIQDAYETLSNPQRRLEYDNDQNKKASSLAISANVIYSRSILPKLEESQLIYALMEVVCTAKMERSVVPPLNLCLVIDRSTSMRGERMDMVKANITQMIKKLSQNDLLSIVTFSDRAEVVIPPTRVSELSKLENRISMLDSGGGTEIYQGLAAGYSQLELRTVRKSIRHILLMTDGHTYGDEPECLELARRSMSEGIIISGLGLGNEWNDKFLDQIASLSGGATQFVSKPSDLMNMLERKIHDIGMVYARGVALEFKGDTGVELRDVFRLHPESGPLHAESPISFGNLQYGRSLTVLLEFQLGPISQSGGKIRLAEGRLKMEIPSRDETVRIPMNLSRPVSAMPSPETPPAQIVEAMSKLILYRMQERARSDVEAGDVVRGTRRLQYLATHLLAQGDRELARTVLTEAEHIQRSKQYSEDGDKRIKYGTKLLLLPSGMEHKNDSLSEL